MRDINLDQSPPPPPPPNSGNATSVIGLSVVCPSRTVQAVGIAKRRTSDLATSFASFRRSVVTTAVD